MWNNGIKYEGMENNMLIGEWSQGRKHGAGRLTFKDGSQLNGFWKDNHYLGEINTNINTT